MKHCFHSNEFLSKYIGTRQITNERNRVVSEISKMEIILAKKALRKCVYSIIEFPLLSQ
jgi:hypothetical protein